MIIKQAELETVCGVTSKIPEHDAPEFAFAGKSNVGKSSLINGLMNRKNLARTSGQPGKTQTINFYRINHEFYFVDLPGYGFAKVSETEKAKWGRMIERYLTKSPTLKLVFLLIDIRHEPGANDKQLYEWITSNGFTPVVIATKLDKINRSQKDKQLKLIRTALRCDSSVKIIPYSAVTKRGREEILALMEENLTDDRPVEQDVNTDRNLSETVETPKD